MGACSPTQSFPEPQAMRRHKIRGFGDENAVWSEVKVSGGPSHAQEKHCKCRLHKRFLLLIVIDFLVGNKSLNAGIWENF